MSCYAYILRSESMKRHYYGHTADLNARVDSHNSSQNKYTRAKALGNCWPILNVIREVRR